MNDMPNLLLKLEKCEPCTNPKGARISLPNYLEGVLLMKSITLAQAADYLEVAAIESTTNVGSILVHIGKNAAGVRFVMVNNCDGETMLTEAL